MSGVATKTMVTRPLDMTRLLFVTDSSHSPTDLLQGQMKTMQETLDTLIKMQLEQSNVKMGTCSDGAAGNTWTTADVFSVINFVLLLVLASATVFILYKDFFRAQREYSSPG